MDLINDLGHVTIVHVSVYGAAGDMDFSIRLALPLYKLTTADDEQP